MTTKNVDYIRPEVEKQSPSWDLVSDVVAGERAVKAKGDIYLPRPNPTDLSEENKARYEHYLQRAVFFNATGRTLEGLVGIAFRQGPEVQVPASMEYVNDDIDGAGGGIANQSHRVLEAIMKTGRVGMLVDFPASNAAISRAQQDRENIHATISTYAPQNIINWRLDANQDYSLVVLKEMVEEPVGFGCKMVDQWRELAIGTRSDEDPGAASRYIVRLWRKKTEGANMDEFEIVDEFEPKNAAGQPWTKIPFVIAGAIDNNSEIDKAPLQDLANLNISHYRNSADYEESAYFIGQPWLAMSGLDEQWVKEVLGDGTYVGSRAVTPLPEGGQPHMLQASPNTLAGEAMDKKEKQMVALGARLLTHGEAIKTAEQSRSETAASHSVLSLAVANMALAYTQALEWASAYTSTAQEAVSYTMPTDFTGLNADANLLNAIVAAWQQGAVPTTDKNAALRQLGVIDPEKDDETIDEEISQAAPDGLGLEDD